MNHEKKNNRAEGSTNPMEKAEDVKRSKDENIDKDFPGYPHYPASEDIMNPKNNTGRITGELDQHSKRDLNKIQLDNPADKTNRYTEDEKEELGLKDGTEADLNDDDKRALESIDGEMGENEAVGSGGTFEATEALTEKDLDSPDAGIDRNLDRTGDDLDLPDNEDETNTEALGQGDEENDYYSLGGDEQSKNEEGRE